MGGKALRFRLEFTIVVVPDFASVVEFEPRTFRAQALNVESVPEQAAYTPLPIARKIRGERGEQVFKRRHFHRFAKLRKPRDWSKQCPSLVQRNLERCQDCMPRSIFRR